MGLGLQSPLTSPAVLGQGSDDAVEISQSSGSSGASGSSSNEDSDTDAHTPTPTVFLIDGIPSNVSEARRELYKKEMEKRKDALEAKRKETEKEYKDKRNALKAQFADIKDAYRAQKRDADDLLSHSKEEREAFIESMKARIEQAKGERETRLETLKAKIASFKNEKKKEKVENIQGRITAFVAKRIEAMTLHITKMNDLVVLNQTQATQKGTGKDTTAFDAAALSALAAINAAKDAILTLSNKQYVVTVTSETSVKSDVQTVKNAIETDMKAANELLKKARRSVSLMIVERAKLMGETVPEEIVQ